MDEPDCAPTAGCPVERALRVLDGKWTVLIIRDLLSGPKRFTKPRMLIAESIPCIVRYAASA